MECLSFEFLDHSVEIARNGPAKIYFLSLLIDRCPFIEVIMFS